MGVPDPNKSPGWHRDVALVLLAVIFFAEALVSSGGRETAALVIAGFVVLGIVVARVSLRARQKQV